MDPFILSVKFCYFPIHSQGGGTTTKEIPFKKADSYISGSIPGSILAM